MDEAKYKAWWLLHSKRAQRMPLTPDEQAAYEAGRQELEAEEMLPETLDELRQTRAEIAALEAKRVRLSEQRRALQQRIALLEANLPDAMKQALGVGN